MKNYLVIGGSSGIGLALAQRLVQQGHRVFATYNQHEQSGSENLSYHPLDVLGTALSFDFLPDTLHGLVYCPGRINLKPFARISPEDFVQDFRLQVAGAVRCIQQALPRLKQADQASIVLFSTVAATTGFNFHSSVSASKGAIEGLALALAAELAPKIRVNVLAPSITDTPLAAALLNTPEKREANAQRHPLRRIGAPEDLAGAAAFLLSDDAGWITAQVLHADGGMGRIK